MIIITQVILNYCLYFSLQFIQIHFKYRFFLSYTNWSKNRQENNMSIMPQSEVKRRLSRQDRNSVDLKSKSLREQGFFTTATNRFKLTPLNINTNSTQPNLLSPLPSPQLIAAINSDQQPQLKSPDHDNRQSKLKQSLLLLSIPKAANNTNNNNNNTNNKSSYTLNQQPGQLSHLQLLNASPLHRDSESLYDNNNTTYFPQSRVEQQSVNQLIRDNVTISNHKMKILQPRKSIRIVQGGTSNRMMLDRLSVEKEKEVGRQGDNLQGKLSQAQQQQHQQPSLTCAQRLLIVKHKISRLLLSIKFQLFITLLTICSLFIQSIRTLFIPHPSDYIIDYINMFLISAFFIQILMNLTTQDYLFSFFFYLDLISTLSICMDISMLTSLFYQSGGNVQQISVIISQTKTSRVAARAVRMMKIFRLARVVKLYKAAIKTKQLNQQKQRQLLKKKLRQIRNYKLSSAIKNQHFQSNDNSQMKLSNPSLPHIGMQTSYLQSSSTSNKINYMGNLNNKNQKVNVVDRIYEQSQGEESGSEYKVKRSLGGKLKARENGQGNTMRKETRSIYEGTQKNEYQNQQHEQQSQSTHSSSTFTSQPRQSKISRIFSQSTVKKIIVVILLIMLSTTVLDINNYNPDNSSWDFLAQFIAKLLTQKDVSIDYINQMIEANVNGLVMLGVKEKLVAVQTPFNEVYSLQIVDYNQLRVTEIGLAEAGINVQQILSLRSDLTLNSAYISSINSTSNSTSTMGSINIIVSYQQFNKIDAGFSIANIIFICLTILYLLQSFNSSIQSLIVKPIQSMLQVVVHPQKNLQQERQESDSSSFKQAMYETLVVQRAIVKIRTLMSTIYGKIGMDLIYNQLFKSQSINPKNYLAIKKKSYCIYGICKIKNWVQISQTLQNDAFTFINQIASIVHKAVYRYGGYGVKNLSDGFLIVFKLPPQRQRQIVEEAVKYKYSKQKQNIYINIFSDFSIYSFIKTIVRIHKQPKLLRYNKDQRMLHQFGNNFQVDMCFTLSIGESIQGMVGSQFKIDPIYLGNKLNEVWKLALIAVKYPNMIIIDKELYDNLSAGLKSHCRVMEYVRLSHYDEGNTEIYSVDLDLQYISPSKGKVDKFKKSNQLSDINLKKEINMQILNNPTEISNYSPFIFINSKKQLRQALKKKMSDEMKKKYQMAFECYIQGDWKEAKAKLENIMKVVKEDVLCRRMYNFMAQRGFKHTEFVSMYKSVGDL